MRIGNLIFAFILEGLGVWISVDSYRLGIKSLSDPGPGLFPFILGISLCVFGLPNCVQSTKNLKFELSMTGEEPIPSGQYLKMIAVVVLLTSYFVFLSFLGFLITSFIFLYGLFLIGYPRRWLFIMAISVVVVIVSYLIFGIVFESPFPRGFLNLG